MAAGARVAAASAVAGAATAASTIAQSSTAGVEPRAAADWPSTAASFHSALDRLSSIKTMHQGEPLLTCRGALESARTAVPTDLSKPGGAFRAQPWPPGVKARRASTGTQRSTAPSPAGCGGG